tara:strand:+ start:669 stop:869 length:201 start_codon:yes stop_codon:yes gene_type:complete
MHIITDCQRCKKDFMYHTTETHLLRTNIPLNTSTLGLDEKDLEEHDFEYVICQECDEAEKNSSNGA